LVKFEKIFALFNRETCTREMSLNTVYSLQFFSATPAWLVANSLAFSDASMIGLHRMTSKIRQF